MQSEKSEQPETAKPKTRVGLFKRLKGRNRYETMENYSICGVVFGALMFAGGIGLTAIATKGIPAIITMMGALLSFLSSVSLVFTWILKEMFLE